VPLIDRIEAVQTPAESFGNRWRKQRGVWLRRRPLPGKPIGAQQVNAALKKKATGSCPRFPSTGAKHPGDAFEHFQCSDHQEPERVWDSSQHRLRPTGMRNGGGWRVRQNKQKRTGRGYANELAI